MATHDFYSSDPSEQTLISFPFDTSQVRTATSEDGQIWFAAKDVCEALNLTWSGKTLQKTPKNWQGMFRKNTPGGEQDLTFINEPALYRIVFRSDKPEAERFCNWVCAEVLPAIRKHGFFGELTPDAEVKITREARGLVQRLVETKDSFERSFLIERAKRLFRLMGQAMPPLNLIGQSVDQLRLPGV